MILSAESQKAIDVSGVSADSGARARCARSDDRGNIGSQISTTCDPAAPVLQTMYSYLLRQI